MSEQERSKLIEEHLPSLQSIMDAYKAQGKTLTETEAEAVRKQIRKDMASGHIDAMENVLGENVLDNIVGGAVTPLPSKPVPRETPAPQPTSPVRQ